MGNTSDPELSPFTLLPRDYLLPSFSPHVFPQGTLFLQMIFASI